MTWAIKTSTGLVGPGPNQFERSNVSVDADGGLIADRIDAGSDVPRPGDKRVRLNLWLFRGAAPTDANPVDVVVASFACTP